jgi:hypothetical protein
LGEGVPDGDGDGEGEEIIAARLASPGLPRRPIKREQKGIGEWVERAWWWEEGEGGRKEGRKWRGMVRLATCFAFGRWCGGGCAAALLGVGVADVIHHVRNSLI